MIARTAAAFSFALAASGCGTFGDTVSEGMCVATDAGCLKQCREQYEGYRDGLPRGEANQLYRQCTDSCRSGGCDDGCR